MRVSICDGITTIDQDDAVIAMAGVVDPEATQWTYDVKQFDPNAGAEKVVDTVNVDISSLRPTLDDLSVLYRKAQVTKQPAWAAAYVNHKARVLEYFYLSTSRAVLLND